jgi:hypothetical protein
VLFGGNIYVFLIFPLGGTTDFLGRFFKSIINAIYVSKKQIFFRHCKNQNKSEKQQKHFMKKSECLKKIFYGSIDGALMML